jgi:hypothetical protein
LKQNEPIHLIWKEKNETKNHSKDWDGVKKMKEKPKRVIPIGNQCFRVASDSTIEIGDKVYRVESGPKTFIKVENPFYRIESDGKMYLKVGNEFYEVAPMDEAESVDAVVKKLEADKNGRE